MAYTPNHLDKLQAKYLMDDINALLERVAKLTGKTFTIVEVPSEEENNLPATTDDVKEVTNGRKRK